MTSSDMWPGSVRGTQSSLIIVVVLVSILLGSWNWNIFSQPLEDILQEKLFKANTIVLEVTVADVLESTLEIRDGILDRLKMIREGSEDVTICNDQNVGQEDFLSMVRMEMMRVILKIIEEGEATTDRLQV